VAEYSATVLQNPIISKLYILKPELTPKILCETDRILLTILKILFTIRKNAIYYGVLGLRQKGTTNTKYEILYVSMKSFLEKGYTKSYITTIAKTLQMSTGNLTFWFPTKEYILAEMLKELCAFQAQADAKEADKKYSLLIEYLFEIRLPQSHWL